MSPATTDREAELRKSLLGLLRDTTLDMEGAADIAGAISSVLAVVHTVVSQFAATSNRAHSSVLWRRLPDELKLETARWLSRGQRARLLGVSRDLRALLLSDTSLWTTIVLPRRWLDGADQAQCMQTLVARSGCRVVDVVCTARCVNPSTQCPDALRDAVLSVLPRARTLVLHTSYFHAGPPSFWTVPTPLLEKLEITDGHGGSNLRLASSWPAKETPLLRQLKLEDTYFDAPPVHQPFKSVVDLELKMGCPSGGACWNHFWPWFPHLERLVLHVNEYGEPPAIPSPPDGLRDVTLRGGSNCESPERIVRTWIAPRVQKLEIYSNERTALHNAAEYLKRSEPGACQSVSFRPLCCPEDFCWVSTVLRGESASVVIKLRMHHDQCPQLTEALKEGTLGSMMRDIVLSGQTIPAIFYPSHTLPALRSLTVLGDEWNDLFRQYYPDPKLRAPALEELVVDLRCNASRLDRVPRFVACIEHGQPLRQITIRLPADFSRPSPVTANVSLDLAHAADQVAFEYLPAVRCHEYPCARYRAPGE